MKSNYHWTSSLLNQAPVMRKSRITVYITATALILILASLLAWKISTPDEPGFQGKTFSEWKWSVGGQEEMKGVLKAMQPEIVPYLIRELDWSPSPLTHAQEWMAKRFGPAKMGSSALVGPPDDPRPFAAYCLGLLGPIAQEAEPKLEALYESKSEIVPRQEVTFALMRIRGEPPTKFVDRVSDPTRSDWYEAVGMIKKFGREASNAVPNLISALETTNNVQNFQLVQAHIFEALGFVHSNPELSIPALIQPLQSSDRQVRWAALRALKQFGSEARPARSALVLLLKDPEPFIRTNAQQLLQEIDGAVAD